MASLCALFPPTYRPSHLHTNLPTYLPNVWDVQTQVLSTLIHWQTLTFGTYCAISGHFLSYFACFLDILGIFCLRRYWAFDFSLHFIFGCIFLNAHIMLLIFCYTICVLPLCCIFGAAFHTVYIRLHICCSIFVMHIWCCIFFVLIVCAKNLWFIFEVHILISPF